MPAKQHDESPSPPSFTMQETGLHYLEDTDGCVCSKPVRVIPVFRRVDQIFGVGCIVQIAR